MASWNLSEIERAVRASWGIDTCSADDRDDWHPRNPAHGQCDITALVVQDLLGGDLLLGAVCVHGERDGYHWWNRLVTGVEIDLTRDPSRPDETGTPGMPIKRPVLSAPRAEAYALLRRRVADWLGPLPPAGTG